MNHWLEIGVGAFLIGMALYGHYKGFIRLAVSMVALIATLVIVHAAMPQVSGFLKENTPILRWIEQGMDSAFGIDGEEGTSEMPYEQRQAIERLNLPEEIKNILIENNNNEVYQSLGVEVFTDYIGNYLANIILNIIGFLILFAVVYFAIYLVMRWLDLMAKLPILSGLNKIAGAILGTVQGLFYLWISCLVVAAFPGAAWTAAVMQQIEASAWLSILYHYNLVSKLVFGVIRGILF